MRYNVSRGAFLKKMNEREGAIIIQVSYILEYAFIEYGQKLVSM